MSKKPVAVVVCYGHTHACLCLAVEIVGHTGGNAALVKRAVATVAIKQTRCLITGDIEIGPAIVIEIGDNDAESVTSAGLEIPASEETSAKVPFRWLR